MNKKNIQAWIFVRGDSLGLPGKNLKLLAGKPLIAYTIEAARKSRFIKEIFVSTDSPTVAACAEQYGAIIPFLRPEELAEVMVPRHLAWRHAIEWNRTQDEFEQMDVMLSLSVTTPLRTAEEIDKGIELYFESGCDSVIAVAKSNRHPAYDMIYYNEDGTVRLCQENSDPLARKRKSFAYDITNLFHISSADYIMQNDNYFLGKVQAIEVPPEHGLDIKTIWDFKLAEIILKEGDRQ